LARNVEEAQVSGERPAADHVGDSTIAEAGGADPAVAGDCPESGPVCTLMTTRQRSPCARAAITLSGRWW
jgi:hypothetical protein